MTRSFHPGPECPCIICRKSFSPMKAAALAAAKPKLGYDETRPCPQCGSAMLKLSGYERRRLDVGSEVQWGCHNDACELNRVAPEVDAAVSVAIFLRFLVGTAKVAFVLALVWLIWRAL